MLNLLAKDIKLTLIDKNNTKRTVLNYILILAMIIIFVTIETFIFSTILNKIKGIKAAPISFLTLFLFIISIIVILFDLMRANRLFFNKKDCEQLATYPINNRSIIISKIILLFIIHYFTSLIFVYPILVSFGVILKKTMWFYYVGIFYPVLSFLFETGFALLLVYPLRIIIEFLKKHFVIQFIISLSIVIVLCIMYKNILNIFMDLVINKNSDNIFTVKTIEALDNIKDYFIPIRFLTDYFLTNNPISLLPYILISLGIFILGMTLTIYSYNYFKNFKFSNKVRKSKKVKRYSITYSLLKKEWILIYKDTNNFFSYSGLVIIKPFLVYLVVESINKIFSSGSFSYYSVALPSFIPLFDILIVMLFTLIINNGANEYITMEKKTIKILKMISIAPLKQIFNKISVPYLSSLISLIISMLVILITGKISILHFSFGLIISIIALTTFEIISLYEELKIRYNKPKRTLISSIFTYLIPVLFFIIAIILSFIGLNIIYVYIGFIALILLIGLPFTINFKEKVLNLFMDLEVIN